MQTKCLRAILNPGVAGDTVSQAAGHYWVLWSWNLPTAFCQDRAQTIPLAIVSGKQKEEKKKVEMTL
jgi:hypothetical protein